MLVSRAFPWKSGFNVLLLLVASFFLWRFLTIMMPLSSSSGPLVARRAAYDATPAARAALEAERARRRQADEAEAEQWQQELAAQSKLYKRVPAARDEHSEHDHIHVEANTPPLASADAAATEQPPPASHAHQHETEHTDTHEDDHAAHGHDARHHVPHTTASPTPRPRSPRSPAAEVDPFAASIPTQVAGDPNRGVCKQLQSEFDIKPGSSWGSATAEAQAKWSTLHCDQSVRDHRPRFGGKNATEIILDDDVQGDAKPSGTTWIAFLTPMTSQFSQNKDTTKWDQLIFWSVLFKSFLKISDAQLKDPTTPYWYSFYIGYDVGDPVLDNAEANAQFRDEFFRQVEQKGNGRAHVGIRFFRMSDTRGAPSWGVSHLAQAAYVAGADYMYQCNDDVQLTTSGWEAALIGALRASHNFGVTGPRDATNQGILTQSFVHRTHLHIFHGLYFSLAFENWWSDDWLTMVYGDRYTHRHHQVQVIHQTGEVGMRYQVAQAKHLLHGEVAAGKARIRAWLAAQGDQYKDIKGF